MPQKSAKPKKNTAPDGSARLIPPPGGAAVRLYRTGHGDCFLLAFAGESENKPVYVLIDCGYKPGSPGFLKAPTKAREIGQHIVQATGGHVDVAVITHEHQDHVNGITETNFKGLSIGEAWFAWTEDPEDDLANQLRKQFKDKLLGLVAARQRVAAAGDARRIGFIDELLAYELGGNEDQPFSVAAAETMLSAAGAGESMNKKPMKVFKDLAGGNLEFLGPHVRPRRIRGAGNLRVYVLGPPRDADLLGKLNPEGDESFRQMALATASTGNYFGEAARGERGPFHARYYVPQDGASEDPELGKHFTQVYGAEGVPPTPPYGIDHPGEDEVAGNADWRRIDQEWLFSTEMLALAMNDQTNNSSPVLAFALGEGGKVLLFAADAQRKNWLSWPAKTWKDGDRTVTARDLLSRTVLYKVGHHSSHNATLDGTAGDEHPNLAWMAEGERARAFTAIDHRCSRVGRNTGRVGSSAAEGHQGRAAEEGLRPRVPMRHRL